MGLFLVLFHFVAHDSASSYFLFFFPLNITHLSFLSRPHDTSPIRFANPPNARALSRIRLVVASCPCPPVPDYFIRRCIDGVQYGAGTWLLPVFPISRRCALFWNVPRLLLFLLSFYPLPGSPGPWLRPASLDQCGFAVICLFLTSHLFHARSPQCASGRSHPPCSLHISVKIDLTADPLCGLRW